MTNRAGAAVLLAAFISAGSAGSASSSDTAAADEGGDDVVGSSEGNVVETIYLVPENDGYFQSTQEGSDPKIGDVAVFHDVLYQTNSDYEEPREVGADSGMCQVTLVTDAATTNYCIVTLLLPKGQIVVAAQWVSTDTDLTMAIVGGTGEYATARGEMIVNNVAANESEELRIMD